MTSDFRFKCEARIVSGPMAVVADYEVGLPCTRNANYVLPTGNLFCTRCYALAGTKGEEAVVIVESATGLKGQEARITPLNAQKQSATI
jgi:hypothetical protein